MKPRLLGSRPPVHQLVLATVPALVFGVVVGLALDLSSGLYAALLVVAVLGGVGAGYEHDGAGEGAQRGLVGGLLFGAGVLAGHHLLQRRVTVALPHPEALEVIVTSLVSVPLGAFGGAIRGRSERRAEKALGQVT